MVESSQIVKWFSIRTIIQIADTLQCWIQIFVQFFSTSLNSITYGTKYLLSGDKFAVLLKLKICNNSRLLKEKCKQT